MEHVTTLLHAMDGDLDDLITVDDLLAHVGARKLPLAAGFPEELLHSMFQEANSSGDGLIDIEQLSKAVGGQFPHRRHNADWYRLFSLFTGPLPANDHLTALPTSPPPPQPIRANFEQHDDIVTFSPLTLPHRDSTGQLSGQLSTKLLQTASVWSTSSGERLHTAPSPHQSLARPHPADLDAAVNARIHATGTLDLPSTRCSFGAQRAFREGNQLAADASDGFHWRSQLPVTPPPASLELATAYYGRHPADWWGVPAKAPIPLRQDGVVHQLESNRSPSECLRRISWNRTGGPWVRHCHAPFLG